MARKQVLVQFDDKLLAMLDREATRSKVSRSELIRHAVSSWFEARKIAHLERRYVEAYRRIPDDPALTEALTRLAAESAPPYEP